MEVARGKRPETPLYQKRMNWKMNNIASSTIVLGYCIRKEWIESLLRNLLNKPVKLGYQKRMNWKTLGFSHGFVVSFSVSEKNELKVGEQYVLLVGKLCCIRKEWIESHYNIWWCCHTATLYQKRMNWKFCRKPWANTSLTKYQKRMNWKTVYSFSSTTLNLYQKRMNWKVFVSRAKSYATLMTVSEKNELKVLSVLGIWLLSLACIRKEWIESECAAPSWYPPRQLVSEKNELKDQVFNLTIPASTAYQKRMNWKHAADRGNDLLLL